MSRRAVFSKRCFYERPGEAVRAGIAASEWIENQFFMDKRSAQERQGLGKGVNCVHKHTKNRKGCKIALQIAEGLVK